MATKPKAKAKPKPKPKPKLEPYRAKRDFRSTPEPTGGKHKRPGKGDGRFVVQEHDATRLHWDLRLERDGVLVSWAIPNGIPMSPKENRLAVHVEDHPLDYIDFEGVIPEGYGAGTVKLWDTGTYQLEKWRPKEVIVTFHGNRLNGKYVLFQTRSKKDWMIHRMDPPADPEREPMPARLVPMLAKLGTPPARDDDFAFEIKWDGIRALAYYEPGRFHIESRNLNDITAQYPELRRLGRQLGSRDTILDGEIVAYDDRGRPSFERLQHRMHLTRDADIKRRAKEIPVQYVLFDVLYLEGRSVMSRPYLERRELLESLALEGPNWQTPAYRRGGGKALVEASAKNGLEGVVAKKLDSTYSPGRRNPSWIKVKNKRRERLVIAGWLPEKERADRLGALLVGYFDRQGHLRYAGRVGTGFNAKERTRLERLLAPLAREGSPFEGKRGPRGAKYVEPQLVAEAEFTEWTNDAVLRHPSYKGLVDEDPESIVLDPAAVGEPDPVEEAVVDSGETSATLGPVRQAGRKAVEVTVEERRLRLTNLDKVMYPKTGFTKRDLIDYFVRIAPVLLPHLHDRPLTLKRYPDGVEGQFFYEKKCPSHRPDWVRTEAVWSRHNEANIDFCITNDVPTLVWLANLADIELHTSMALAKEITRPTMMVFDLDPGPPADIVACCRVGLMLRDMFEQLGLQSFAKTSGSKGLQIYVPLNVPVTYDDTKPFARVVAELMEKQHPDQIVSRMTKSLRDGKVFIDWSQNDEHKTTVCVYSLRAKEQPTVSTPVTWDEVADALKRRSAKRLTFDYAEVLDRVERDGDMFAPVLAMKQELPQLGAGEAKTRKRRATARKKAS
jgi:bifunctional non-homologous end joining protein LigD